MFSELILPGEPFELDTAAVPFAENHPFGFAEPGSLWWSLCGPRGQKHCSGLFSLYFLGPSSNTQSFLHVWAGSAVPRTPQYYLHGCLAFVLKLLDNTVAWSYAGGSGVKCLALQGFRGSLLVVASEVWAGQGEGCQHRFPLCPSTRERAAGPVLKHKLCDPVVPLAMEIMSISRDNVCRLAGEKEWWAKTISLCLPLH